MRVLAPDDLRLLPPPAEVLTHKKVLTPSALPRRNPLSPFAAVLGGMVDAVNAALLDACPKQGSVFPKFATVDFSPLVRDKKLVYRLFRLVASVWPAATLKRMTVSIEVPAFQAKPEPETTPRATKPKRRTRARKQKSRVKKPR